MVFYCSTKKDGKGNEFWITVSNEFLSKKEIKILQNAEGNEKISFTGIIDNWQGAMEFRNTADKDSKQTFSFD